MHKVDSSRWNNFSGSFRSELDEYSRAIAELERLLMAMPVERYTARTELSDENFVTPRDILKHMLGAAFSYSNYLEDAIEKVDRGARTPEMPCETPAKAMESLWAGFYRTVDVLTPIREYDDVQQTQIKFRTRWGSEYDVEQMMEHAIVHVLRHRRQLERWVATPLV